jgi:polar amino acid transport system substrate-binding protein
MEFPRALMAAFALLAAAAGAPAAEPPSSAALRDLAPTGKLRVTFIVSNPVHVVRDASGEFRGPAIDLGRELAKRLGVAFEPVGHPRAEDIVTSAKAGGWDVAFLAFDPARSAEVDFSPAYLEAHNGYLASAASAIASPAEADRSGVRIGVGQRDAVDLHLTRTLKHAELVRNTGGTPGALELIRSGKVDLYAANRQRLEELAAKLPGTRILEGSVLAVQQSMALPKGRDAGLAFVATFVAGAKASGLVAQSIARAGLRGVTVAP